MAIDGSETFETGTGADTFNGAGTVVADKDLRMAHAGSGSLSTGAGTVPNNSDTTQQLQSHTDNQIFFYNPLLSEAKEGDRCHLLLCTGHLQF